MYFVCVLCVCRSTSRSKCAHCSSRIFKVKGSNLRIITYADFKTPLTGSKSRWAEPICPVYLARLGFPAMFIAAALNNFLPACCKEAKAKIDTPLSGPSCLEGATLANRLATSRNYKHSWTKIGLEYGVPTSSGFLRKSTGENGFPRIPSGSLLCCHRDLRTSPETSGSLQDDVI